MLKEPRSKRASEPPVKILPLVMDQNQNPTTFWTKLRAASVLNGIGWLLPGPRLNSNSTMGSRSPNLPGHEVILDLSTDSTTNVTDENSENMELLVLQHNPVLLALRAYQTHLELWNKVTTDDVFLAQFFGPMCSGYYNLMKRPKVIYFLQIGAVISKLHIKFFSDNGLEPD